MPHSAWRVGHCFFQLFAPAGAPPIDNPIETDHDAKKVRGLLAWLGLSDDEPAACHPSQDLAWFSLCHCDRGRRDPIDDLDDLSLERHERSHRKRSPTIRCE
jgi:hypothetical protein